MGANSPKHLIELFIEGISKITDAFDLKRLPNKDRKDLFILTLAIIAIVWFYSLKIITPREARITSCFYILFLLLRGIHFTITH